MAEFEHQKKTPEPPLTHATRQQQRMDCAVSPERFEQMLEREARYQMKCRNIPPRGSNGRG